MPIVKMYVATPPQFFRSGNLSSGNTAYEVGDRINNGTYLYVCSTAGIADGSLYYNVMTGGASVTWGTSVWTLTASTSFATAGIYNVGMTTNAQVVNYLDCFCVHAAGGVDAAVVVLHPGTMEPHPLINYTALGGGASTISPTFYGGLQNYGYNTMPVLTTAGTHVSSGAKRGARGSGVILSSPGIYSLYGCDFSGVATVSSPVTLEGIGNSLTFTGGLGTVAANAPMSKVAGVGPAGTFTVPYAEVEGTASVASPLSGCSISTANYRNGVAPTGQPPMSYLVSDNGYGSVGRKEQLGNLSFHNTLTGVRTLTVHLLTDSPYAGVDLWNDNLWIDVWYLGGTNGALTYATTEDPNIGLMTTTKTLIPTEAVDWTYNTGAYFSVTALKISKTVTITEPGLIYFSLGIAGHRVKVFNVFLCPFAELV